MTMLKSSVYQIHAHFMAC